jgi:hypothetical protein
MNRASPLAADFTALLGASSRESSGWDPFLLHIVDETPLHARVSFRDLALGVYLSGRHMIRRQIGANVVEGWSDPGMINLTPPGVEGIWEATASSRAVVVVIRPKFLSRAIEEHWGADSSKVEIIMQFLIRDPVIERVTLNGTRSRAMYGDSACEFLAHRLIHRYSSLSQPPPPAVGGHAQKDRVGTWEIPRSARAIPLLVRIGKGKPIADDERTREVGPSSSSCKAANKAERSAAEPVEPRAGTKGAEAYSLVIRRHCFVPTATKALPRSPARRNLVRECCALATITAVTSRAAP